jgi:pyridoxal phosphate enzyme (YggS family)
MKSRAEELHSNLKDVEDRIQSALNGRNRESVTLIVVTKTFPTEDVQHLYNLGVRHFGENRDHEGSEKAPAIPSDAHWYFQGEVQSRKIKSISGWAKSVLSLDSLDHAKKFASYGEREFFLQVNLQPERVDRGGVAPSEITRFIESSAVPISGLMCVPPLDRDPKEAFIEVATIHQSLQEQGFSQLKGLSIGMSADFEVAISAGATHVRVGSSILGSRPPIA